MNRFWFETVPIWVSRPNADEFIMELKVSGWIFMLIGLLAVCNALVWGCLGIYFAVRVFT